MDILASVYVYGYKTFVAEMNAEWFILSLIVLGVALAVVAVIGFYAVRFEHGLYLKMVRWFCPLSKFLTPMAL